MRPGAVVLAKVGWTFTALWLALRVTGSGSMLLPVVAALLYSAIAYPLVDRPFLFRPGQAIGRNWAACIGEGLLVVVLTWALAGILPNAQVSGPALLLAGTGVAVGEWFVHLALRGPVPVSERHNRPPGISDE
ncbi:MAG TPA: DUF2512 family protein [Sphingobacteriaceae bacterium]|nr:DUF2512 family protein [Sphingobacteriaceae bacterium]